MLATRMSKKTIVILSALALVGLIGAIVLYKCRFVSNPWNVSTLGEIPTPAGYERVSYEGDAYVAFLRGLPLKPRGAKVQLYTGGDAKYQFLSAGVIDWPVLSNSEQCADMTMRIRAEFLWQSGQYDKIKFRDVNNKWHPYKGGSSRKALEQYLKEMYGCCSTFSVFHETNARAIQEVRPGDVLVYPARPGKSMGHAVLVADVARNASGKILILCVEGNTPACEAHVVRNHNPFRNPWFVLNEGDGVIRVSVFKFLTDELRYYSN